MGKLVRAAQYLRMSTEHQRYSPINQAAAIAAYARAKGYKVVKTYADEGISGLGLKNRKGLQALLSEALGGAPEFDVILAYDVSRWGRFQNPDQSAHYEFLCSDAGVPVEYCAEPFTNDGSLSSTLLKAVKRVMAAEFSRQLSVRVIAGRRRLTQEGYWLNGRPGYGFRRLIVDERNRPYIVLEDGQRKAIQDHHARLAPGPAAELETVQRIFHLCVNEGLGAVRTAARLNAEGLVAEGGVAWTQQRVRGVLTNPKYIGDRRSNMTTNSLEGGRKARPRDEWTYVEASHDALVPKPVFDAAQAARTARTVQLTKAEMLEALRRLLTEHGQLSYKIINNSRRPPSSTALRERFGSVRAACMAVGWDLPRRLPPCGKVSDDELLDRLRDLLRTHGYLSTQLINSIKEMPSTGALRRRFGTLSKAYERIGYVQPSPYEIQLALALARGCR